MLLLAACLLAFGVTTVALWWPQLTASEEVSDLYRRYADDGHLDVAFIRGFRVNDTLRLDVTTLQARDSVGWERLKEDFSIKEATLPVQESIAKGDDVVTVRLTPRDNPGQPMDTTDMLLNDVLAVSRLHMTVSVFNISSEQEIDAVIHSKYQ